MDSSNAWSQPLKPRKTEANQLSPMSTEKRRSPSPPIPIPSPKFVEQKRKQKFDPTVATQKFPLGFDSMEQFRELTRPIAKANRDGVVIVSGSSVTGYSARKGTKFDQNPKKPKSDIDVGIIHPTKSGFPEWGSEMSRVEQRYQKAVLSTLQRPTGIKFFTPDEMKHDGRSYMIRPHTPPKERK